MSTLTDATRSFNSNFTPANAQLFLDLVLWRLRQPRPMKGQGRKSSLLPVAVPVRPQPSQTLHLRPQQITDVPFSAQLCGSASTSSAFAHPHCSNLPTPSPLPPPTWNAGLPMQQQQQPQMVAHPNYLSWQTSNDSGPSSQGGRNRGLLAGLSSPRLASHPRSSQSSMPFHL